jgi:hypothetical protein
MPVKPVQITEVAAAGTLASLLLLVGQARHLRIAHRWLLILPMLGWGRYAWRLLLREKEVDPDQVRIHPLFSVLDAKGGGIRGGVEVEVIRGGAGWFILKSLKLLIRLGGSDMVFWLETDFHDSHYLFLDFYATDFAIPPPHEAEFFLLSLGVWIGYVLGW